MKAISQRFGFGWIGLLASLVMDAVTHAQTGSISPSTSGSSATLAAFLQEQQALAQEWQTLVSQGATQQQLISWRQQNVAQFQAQQQLAQALAIKSALQPMPVIAEIEIPADASGTLEDFLTTNASLANARAQIHNQFLQALPEEASQEEVGTMQRQEAQIFWQVHALDLQIQRQRAQTLAVESASQPLPVPGATLIPPNATPQFRAYVTARNALARDRAELWNQYVTADPGVRQAAMSQWRQRNASRLEQLQELAQELSNSIANQ